jgi:hypothetical protein
MVCAVARRHWFTPQQLVRRHRAARRQRKDEGGESGSVFVSVTVETARPCLDVPVAPAQPIGRDTRIRQA